jgi:hypothetical protein
MTGGGSEYSSGKRDESREYDEDEDLRREVKELIDEAEREKSDEDRERQEYAENDDYEREVQDLIDEIKEENRKDQTEAEEQKEHYSAEEVEDLIREAVQELEHEEGTERESHEETEKENGQFQEHEREEGTEHDEDGNLSEWEKDVIKNYANYGADPEEVRELWREHFEEDVKDELGDSESEQTVDEKKEDEPDEESGLERTEDTESYYDDGSGQMYAMRTESSEQAESSTETETTEDAETAEAGKTESSEGDLSKENAEAENVQSQTAEDTRSTEGETVEQSRTGSQEHAEDSKESQSRSGTVEETEPQSERTSQTTTAEYVDEAGTGDIERKSESGYEGEAEDEPDTVETTESRSQETEDSTESASSEELTPEDENWQRELNEMFNQLPEEFQEAIREYIEEEAEEDFEELVRKHGLEDLLKDEEAMEEVEEFLRYRRARRLNPEASAEELAEEVGIDAEQAEKWEDRENYPDAVKRVLNLEGYRVLDSLARGFREQDYPLDPEEYVEYLRDHPRLEFEDPMAPFEEWDREARAWIEVTRMRREGRLRSRLRNGRERYDREQIKALSKEYGVSEERVVSWLRGETVPYLIRRAGRERVRSSGEAVEENTMASRLQMWKPEVNGVRIRSVEQLEELVRARFPSLMKRKDYQRFIRQAALHLELVEHFQNKELKRGDIARIVKETGESPTTIKRWVIEGTKPRIYHYLTRNPLDDREERVAKILSSLQGVINMERLERRLRTLFFFEGLERSKSHTGNLERARLFFDFLEEYTKGGILKSVAKRMKIGKGTVSDWLSGSALPTYVRLAVAVPAEPPEPGKKWLPLRLNTRTNLPERFIQVPEVVNSEEDLLSVLRQLQSLHTNEMTEFEKRYGKESVRLSFMYLLGLGLSDGQFDSDSDLSARVVLFASKKYKWRVRLGRAFSLAMGKVGLIVERRADSTKIRNGKVIECNVWASQASPFLQWVKTVLFGLRHSLMKKQSPIDAEWILKMPKEYRVAFLQGLADGDGYASIKAFRVGIASKPNGEFIKRLLSTFNIFAKLEKTKVVIKKHEDIIKANNIPLFRHATSRKRNHYELCSIIGLLDKSHGKVPEREIKIIMELHRRGFSCGEITERLWFDHGLARSRGSVEGIVRRRTKSKGFK